MGGRGNWRFWLWIRYGLWGVGRRAHPIFLGVLENQSPFILDPQLFPVWQGRSQCKAKCMKQMMTDAISRYLGCLWWLQKTRKGKTNRDKCLGLPCLFSPAASIRICLGYTTACFEFLILLLSVISLGRPWGNYSLFHQLITWILGFLLQIAGWDNWSK